MRTRFNKKDKNSRKKRTRYLILVLVFVLLLGGLTGIYGKYISTFIATKQMHSAGFYVSSDYLEAIVPGTQALLPKIPVSGWDDGIHVELYNWETEEGQTHITEPDVTFTVQDSSGWTASFTGDRSTLSSGAANDTQDTAYLTLMPPVGAEKGDTVTLLVTTGPYKATLAARFTLTDAILPDYTVEEKGVYELVTIHSNNYSGEITVTWDKDIWAPDVTNPLMEDWIRDAESGTISASEFRTYELKFFEEVSQNYEDKSGIGTNVPIE